MTTATRVRRGGASYQSSPAIYWRILRRDGCFPAGRGVIFRQSECRISVDHVKPKLHTLCCHAADVLEAFGSLGRYSEQGLEAWHGHYNQNSRLYTADIFLESCLSYVKKSAIARASDNTAHN